MKSLELIFFSETFTFTFYPLKQGWGIFLVINSKNKARKVELKYQVLLTYVEKSTEGFVGRILPLPA